MKIKIYPPKVIFELGKRSNQEDSTSPGPDKATAEDRLFVICDGMGGHERGEVASGTVCKGLTDYFREHINPDDVLADEQLKEALEHAYKQLDAIDDGAYRKPGTTMALLYFHRGGCTAAHIGDSRIYHIRPSSQTILYLSRDHSLVFDLYQVGEISYKEMKTHPRRNQITRVMTPGEENRRRADIVHITDIKPDDYFFICSDGMLEAMEDDEIVNLLASNTDDDNKHHQLLEMTAGNSDNHSAIILHIKEVEVEEGDSTLLNDEQTVRFNAINIHPETDEDAEELPDSPEVFFDGPEEVDDSHELEEEDTKVVNEQIEEEEPKESHLGETPTSHAQPQKPNKSSLRKWLPLLLCALILAAGALAYMMMTKSSKGGNAPKENTNKANTPAVQKTVHKDSLTTNDNTQTTNPQGDNTQPTNPQGENTQPTNPQGENKDLEESLKSKYKDSQRPNEGKPDMEMEDFEQIMKDKRNDEIR